MLRIRQLAANCCRFLAGMAGVVCIGYDWPCLESLCRMSGIRLNRGLVEKLRKLEDLDIKYLNKKEVAANG